MLCNFGTWPLRTRTLPELPRMPDPHKFRAYLYTDLEEEKKGRTTGIFNEVYQYFQWEDVIGWMLRLNQSMKATYMKYVLLRWKAAQYLHQRQTDKTFCCLFNGTFSSKIANNSIKIFEAMIVRLLKFAIPAVQTIMTWV